MKALPFLVAVAALIIALIAVMLSVGGPPAPPARTTGDGAVVNLSDLERRIADLEARNARRRRVGDEPSRDVSRPLRRTRDSQPRRPSPGVGEAGGASAAIPGSGREFLDGWVRSFEDGGSGEGAEFFRLGVVAFAPQLLDELAMYAVDESQPDAFRVALVQLLGAARFRDRPEAADALADVLRGEPSDALRTAAIEGITATGDARRAVELEALAISANTAQTRTALIAAMAQLAGSDANDMLLRALGRESTKEVRAAIAGLVNGADEETALDIIGEVSHDAYYPTRNRAAEKLGNFRSDAARQLLDGWLAREDQASVKARLRASRNTQNEIPKYAPERVIGPPDVLNPASDSPNAWCPKQQNGGIEWLELTFDSEIAATHVRVHQVYTPGAISKIEVADERGRWSVQWRGDDSNSTEHLFEAELEDAGVATSRVRITFDTARRSGWHEIDAVQLVGAGGNAWASRCVASSTWGQ